MATRRLQSTQSRKVTQLPQECRQPDSNTTPFDGVNSKDRRIIAPYSLWDMVVFEEMCLCKAMHDEMPCGPVAMPSTNRHRGHKVRRIERWGGENGHISSSCGAPERSTKYIFPDMTSAEI
jgi:hypothetical protein